MVVLSDKHQFYEIIRDFEVVPLTQSEGWYDYIHVVKPDGILLLVDDLENPSIACLAHEKKFFRLKMLQIEGECFRSADIVPDQIKSFYRDVTSFLSYDFIEINSNTPYHPSFEIGMREAGFMRPVGVFSCYLTKDVDLREELVLSSNWKRNLKKASKHQLFFEIADPVSEDDIRDFVGMYHELLQDKKFGHRFSDLQFSSLLVHPDFHLVWLKNEAGKKIASFVYYRRNKYGESVFRAKTKEAMNNGATFLIYIRLLEFLKGNGCEIFNMGRQAPGPQGNVFSFKNGIKGNYYAYNGEWSWYRKKYYRILMYFVKKYLFKRQEV